MYTLKKIDYIFIFILSFEHESRYMINKFHTLNGNNHINYTPLFKNGISLSVLKYIYLLSYSVLLITNIIILCKLCIV